MRAHATNVLKNFLDILPLDTLRGKPVTLAVVGATPHHYLGVDLALRAALAWFGAIALPTSVYLTGADFDETRQVAPPARRQLEELADALVCFASAFHGIAIGPNPLAGRIRP